MALPRLNRLLALEERQSQSDGAGGWSESWVARGVLWAEIQSTGGRERAQGEVAVWVGSFRIIVRAAPLGHPERPTIHDRFREGGRSFSITDVREHDIAGRYLACSVQEELWL